jgi:hypothetical protein
MPSILQPWVEELGLRHQGVLVSAMRGCDLAPRHDPSKLAQRLLRGAVLEPHCGRMVKPVSYIVVEPDEKKWHDTMNAFVSSWDHYPNHYVMHFIQAAEIIGYSAPLFAPCFAERWKYLYEQCANILHLNAETKEQLDHRLNADEEAFGRMQLAYGR